MSDDTCTVGRGRFELEDLDDAQDAGRHIKCRCEELIELHHESVVTVAVSVEEVGFRERR